MDKEINNRPTHYKKKPLDESKTEYYSLRYLASEIFPDLGLDHAYRKTLKHFPTVCELMGHDHNDFKRGRDYKVPASQKSGFVILIRHADLYKSNHPLGNQRYDKVREIPKSLIQMKEEHVAKNWDTNHSDHQLTDYGNLIDLFYGPNHLRPLILHEFQKEIIELIKADFKFLSEEVPSDRSTIYTEQYCQNLKKEILKQGEFFRKLSSIIE